MIEDLRPPPGRGVKKLALAGWATGGEAIAVTAAERFDQPLSFHLAPVVAQRAERVGVGREAAGAQHRLVHLAAAPAGDLGAAVQQHFQQAH